MKTRVPVSVPYPPEKVPWSVAEPPIVIVPELETVVLIVGEASATATETAFDVTVTPAASVTWSSNDHLPAVRVPVEAELAQSDEARSLKLLKPGGSTSHSHAYEGVPPLAGVVIERVEFWPAVSEVGATEITGTTSAGLTVTVSPFEQAAADEESVTS